MSILSCQLFVSNDDINKSHYQINLQGWENSAYSPFIEFPIGKLVIEELFENDAWYEIARNDKENSYTNQSRW